MAGSLAELFPNAAAKWPDFLIAVRETLVMELWAGGIVFVLGLLLGITVVVTREGGILENPVLFRLIDRITDLFRSIPFIILLTAVMPVTRQIMGTAIGVRGVIVPLVFGAVPFFIRQVEAALAQTDQGLVEAALSMGSTPLEIIQRVYLRESIAPLTRGTTITAVSLLGLTAMAGAVGGGGLGDFAIRYGHDRNMQDITWITVIILVFAVSAIQYLGGRIAKKYTH